MKYGTDATQMEKAQNSFLQAIAEQPKAHWYLWVDIAFNVADGIDTPLADTGLNIYQVNEMVDLEHLGPRIVQVFAPGDQVDKARELLRLWLEHTNGRPMLSLWASDRRIEKLAQHMRAWCWAQTPDKETVLLRLADTRSVCNLHKTLLDEQWHGLTHPLLNWLYINRQGAVASLPVVSSSSTPLAKPSIELSEAQVQAMVLAAEPDALLHYIATQMPELVPQKALPSKMHAYTVSVCKLAEKHDVSHFLDRLTMLVSACTTQGKSLTDKSNLDMLSHKRYITGHLAQAWSLHL